MGLRHCSTNYEGVEERRFSARNIGDLSKKSVAHCVSDPVSVALIEAIDTSQNEQSGDNE